MSAAIYMHADPASTVTTATQGSGYPVLSIHTTGLDLSVFGPVSTDAPARLAFAQALADAAAAFLAAEQQYSAPAVLVAEAA